MNMDLTILENIRIILMEKYPKFGYHIDNSIISGRPRLAIYKNASLLGTIMIHHIPEKNGDTKDILTFTKAKNSMLPGAIEQMCMVLPKQTDYEIKYGSIRLDI